MGGPIKDKTRKGLVRLIEEHLKAKLKGSVEPDTEFLEDFRTDMMIYTPWCPPLKDVSKKEKYISGFQQESCMIKVVNLKIRCSIGWRNAVVWSDQCLIIPKGMKRQNPEPNTAIHAKNFA